MVRSCHYYVIEYCVFVEVTPNTPFFGQDKFFDVLDSWIAFAPVATLTRDFFGLSSTTPVNWLSTVVLFVYCIVSPLTAYIFHHHGVRTGVFPYIGRINCSS